MRIVEGKDINKERWDALVDADPNASIYNSYHFLSMLSENWCAIVYDDYKGIMPLPYSKRIGITGIYTPNFIRAIDWIGERPSSFEKIEEQIHKRFKRCDLNMSNSIFHSTDPGKHYQIKETSSEIQLNSNGKRALKRFEKSQLIIENGRLEDVLTIVSDELQEKVDSLREIDLQRFEKVLTSYDTKNMYVLKTIDNDSVVGGQIFIHWKNRLLYVKGGCLSSAKEEGAMFAMMQRGIEYAQSKGLVLDFGGSNIEGVRRFNCSFGAKDVSYHTWSWNEAPFWFNWLLKLKSK